VGDTLGGNCQRDDDECQENWGECKTLVNLETLDSGNQMWPPDGELQNWEPRRA
jgi:hypothetical protein